MIHYNTYDLHKAPKYIDIIEFLGGTEIRDDHVWAIARESHDIPVFENIWYQITLNEIYNKTFESYGENLDYFVNSRDTHLYYQGDEIYDLSDFKDLIEQWKTQ